MCQTRLWTRKSKIPWISASQLTTHLSMYGQDICVELQRAPMKLNTKYPTHTFKDVIFVQCLNAKNIWELICVFKRTPSPSTTLSDLLKDTSDIEISHWYCNRYWFIETGWRICASLNYVNIGSDNSLSRIWRQTIIYTNVVSLPIGPLGTYFSEIGIKIRRFSYSKRVWKCRLSNGGHVVSASLC